MNKTDILPFLSGFLCGVLCMLVINTPAYKDKLDECELDLPRTERCVMIAVPEKDVE
mgnify:CR=1 FL=1